MKRAIRTNQFSRYFISLFFFFMSVLSIAEPMSALPNPLSRDFQINAEKPIYPRQWIPSGVGYVGSLSGSLVVTPSGQAQYSIPIDTPPGTAGMAPALVLQYDSSSSHTKDGVLGMGFSLQGLTSIVRVGQTLGQNGKHHEVDFTNDDRFALDGEQFVAMRGGYGESGTEYRTYQNSYAKVVSNGQQGRGPQSFKVWTKGGQVAEYGGAVDARYRAYIKKPDGTLMDGETVSVWGLNRIEDRAGNYLEVHYQNDPDTGLFYPVEVDYTGNAKTGLVPYNSIQFFYEDRPDENIAYHAGSKQDLKKRLKRITVNEGTGTHVSKMVYEYRLNYEISQNTLRSRLISLEKCDGSGVCYRPTTFSWQTNEEGWEPAPSYAPKVSIVDGSKNQYDNGVRFVDLDGDGVLDMVHSVYRKPAHSYINNGTTWVEDTRYQLPVPIVTSDRRDAGLRFMDFTGTGQAAFVQNNYAYTDSYLHDGQSWQKAPSYHLPNAIVDGQGLENGIRFVDLGGKSLPSGIQRMGRDHRLGMWMNTGNGFQAVDPLTSPYKLPAPIVEPNGEDDGFRLVDFKGNNLEGIIQSRIGRTGGGAWYNDGTHWVAAPEYASPVGHEIADEHGADDGIRFMRFQGDGLISMVQSNENGREGAWQNVGTGWKEDSTHKMPDKCYIAGPYGDEGVRFMDFIGNGLEGFVKRIDGSGLSDAWMNNGKGWTQKDSYKLPISIVTSDGYDLGVRFIDLRGRGLPDIVFGDEARHEAYFNKAKKLPDYMVGIKDGLGETTWIDYEPLSGKRVSGYADVYTKEHTGRYPTTDYQGPMYVVYQTGVKNAINDRHALAHIPAQVPNRARFSSIPNDPTQYMTTYHYAGAKVNHEGWGFLGFHQVTATDESTGITKTTTYSQDFNQHLIGMVTNTETRTREGVLIHTESWDWKVMPQGSGKVNETYYNRYADYQVEKKYDLEGVLLSTMETRTSNDGSGNPITVIEKITDAQTGEASEIETGHQYMNDEANWLLGELTQAGVTKRYSNAATISRGSSFSYDGSGFLKEETVEPNDADFKLTKAYQRDGYGNIIQKTISGTDLEMRVEKSEYDEKGRFAVLQTNALGQVTRQTIDERFGKPLTVTDLNGLTVRYYYNDFGRLTKESHPDGTEKHYDYGWVTPESAGFAGTVYAEQVTETNAAGVQIAPIEIGYYDSLNREIAHKRQGFNGDWIIQETHYNELDLVTEKSEPYVAGERSRYVEMSYDVLGRLQTTLRPDGNLLKYRYTRNQTLITNALNQTLLKVMDAQGNLLSSTDNLDQTTHYAYDAYGNLIKLTDVKGHVTTKRYDRIGRNLMEEEDPDRGHLSYRYDVLGELVSETDGVGDKTSYEYDKLGRLIKRTDGAGTSVWEYDTAAHGLGKLAKETGVANRSGGRAAGDDLIQAAKEHLVNYNQAFSYDELSRLTDATVTLNGTSYSKHVDYDIAGRESAVTYPGGEKVMRHYNSFGYYDADTNGGSAYWRINRQDAWGHTTDEMLGNGLETLNTYEVDTGYLSDTQTVATSALILQQELLMPSSRDAGSSSSAGLIVVSNQIAGSTSGSQKERLGGVSRSWIDSGDSPPTKAHKSLNRQAFFECSSLNPRIRCGEKHPELTQEIPPADGVVFRASPRESQSTDVTQMVRGATQNGRLLQWFHYTYDALGDVRVRKDGVLGREDNMKYDDLNRLESWIYGKVKEDYTYDELGNIKSKSDVGEYHYGANAGPHAVTSITDAKGQEIGRYTYDANGNQQTGTLSGSGRTIRYTSFNKPKDVVTDIGTPNEKTTSFYYGADREECLRVDHRGTQKTTTFYWGDYEIASIEESGSTVVEQKYYIGSVIKTVRSDKTIALNYLLTDALGSVMGIADDQGRIVERFQYTPFGMQKQIEGSALKNPITHRGFTGHEELEGMDLIHTGGRLYDPKLGRFLSADPYIQDIGNGQSLNRYSYVLNNPLTYSDPTGYFSWRDFTDALGDAIHAIGHAIDQCLEDPIVAQGIGISLAVLAWAFPPVGISGWVFSAMVSSVYGGIVTAQNGGSALDALKSAVVSFGSALALHGIGAHFGGNVQFGSLAWGEDSVAHGLVGGGMTALEGGSFQDGFLSGAVAQAVPIDAIGHGVDSQGTHLDIIAERTFASAVVGGTTAAATGGNFADGAKSAAYGELYNDLAEAMVGCMRSSNAEQRQVALNSEKAILKDPGTFLEVGLAGFIGVPGIGEAEALEFGVGGITALYRAVGPAELADIQLTGRFINRGSSLGKYFSTASIGVSSYAKQAVNAFGDKAYTMVSTEIASKAITPIMRATVDSGISSVTIPNSMLSRLNPIVHNWMPIP